MKKGRTVWFTLIFITEKRKNNKKNKLPTTEAIDLFFPNKSRQNALLIVSKNFHILLEGLTITLCTTVLDTVVIPYCMHNNEEKSFWISKFCFKDVCVMGWILFQLFDDTREVQLLMGGDHYSNAKLKQARSITCLMKWKKAESLITHTERQEVLKKYTLSKSKIHHTLHPFNY